ncbi:metallophosphoesterase family protein [Bradyrhizobium sp. TZ2]
MTGPKIQEMPPEKLRFLHFSDIHFGQEKNGAWVHDDIRREVLNDCQKCLNEGTIRGAPNAIIITGDVAYAGKEAEFKRAVDWLDQLTSIVGCDRLAVHLIPGNHDVDVKVLGSAGVALQAELRKKERRGSSRILS